MLAIRGSCVMKKRPTPLGLFHEDNVQTDGKASNGPALSGSELTPRQRALVTLYGPQDVVETLEALGSPVKVIILDPWYNKGIGGMRADYDDWLAAVVEMSSKLADHVYVWGFPEIIWK